MIGDVHPGYGFFPIPDLWAKKAPDPGSATYPIFHWPLLKGTAGRCGVGGGQDRFSPNIASVAVTSCIFLCFLPCGICPFFKRGQVEVCVGYVFVWGGGGGGC